MQPQRTCCTQQACRPTRDGQSPGSTAAGGLSRRTCRHLRTDRRGGRRSQTAHRARPAWRTPAATRIAGS